MTPAAPRRLVAVGAVLAAVLLLLAAPSPAASVRTLTTVSSATDQAAPLVALLALVAWLLAAWLLLVLAVTAGGHLPGAAGRGLAAVARRLAPATVRRAVEVALGLTVAVGALGASPAMAAPAPGLSLSGAASGQVSAPDLDWGSPAPESSAGGHATSADAPGVPGGATPAAQDLDGAAQAFPSADPVPAPPAAPADPAVVVEPGDSLWVLAERDLAARGASTSDAAVAQAWPTWWAANRDAVGDDPDLLQPGTRLTPPAGGSTPPASS